MERLHEIKKEAYAENLSCLSHWEPRNLPSCDQDDQTLLLCVKRWFLHLLFQIFRGLMAACASGFSLFASIVLRPDNYEVIRLLALPLPHRVDYLKVPHAYCNMISTILCVALSQYQ